MSEYPRGRFCWMDLMTSDPDAAEGFYTKITGWGTEIWEGGEMPYKMFTNSGTALGGGANLFITKPFSNAEVIGAVSRLAGEAEE